jgi:negative regulator of flagellin synthesis FlgM
MADKIDGLGRTGVDVRPAKARSAAPAQTSGTAASGTARGAPARDAVQITDTATRLKSIEARLAGVPDVDRSRVEAVRRKLESGDYEVNPGRVAQKLLKLEQDLSS